MVEEIEALELIIDLSSDANLDLIESLEHVS
jgi:hypothetical protein